MIKKIINNTLKHLKPLFNFIVKKEGVDGIDYPKVVFHTKIQDCDECLLTKTAYFDPNTNKIHLFVCDNMGTISCKSICRSFAHECIHYIQEFRGDIAKSGYSGDKITEDDNLIKLEEESFLKCNMLFRSYTELLNKD